MSGYRKLRAVLVEKGISREELAKTLGVHRTTLSSKLHQRGTDFTLKEARLMASIYHIPVDVFFSPKGFDDYNGDIQGEISDNHPKKA